MIFLKMVSLNLSPIQIRPKKEGQGMFKPQNILSERIANLRAENAALKSMGVFIALRYVVSHPGLVVMGSDEWADLQIALGIIRDGLEDGGE